MRSVLCYGDSNTHGARPWPGPDGATRWELHIRWPGQLQARCPDWYVIEEGLPGRTTVHCDPVEGDHLNGLTVLPAVLNTHRPLDAVVIMLGSNDLKARFALGAFDIAQSVVRLVGAVRASATGPANGAPKILVLSPIPIEEKGHFAQMFAGGAAKSRQLAGYLAEMVPPTGADLIDLAPLATADPDEGLHLGQDAHTAIAAAVAGWLTTI